MSALDDLNAAIVTLSTSVDAEIAALNAAIAADDSVAIEAAVSNLNALNAKLSASVTPAPVVA